MATQASGSLILPPLLAARAPVLRVALAVLLPIAYGALCGWALGVNAALYLVLAAPVAILGGLGAGIEHLGAAAGAQRGALGGLLFGAAIVIVHGLIGSHAEVALPHPAVVLAIFTCVSGAALGALGGLLRARLERRGPAAAAPQR
jgi:hypothetical protein